MLGNQKILVFTFWCLVAFWCKNHFNQENHYSQSNIFEQLATLGQHRQPYKSIPAVNNIGLKIETIIKNISQNIGVFKAIESAENTLHENRYRSFIDKRAKEFCEAHDLDHSSFFLTPMPTTITLRKDSLDLIKPEKKIKLISGGGEWESIQISVASNQIEIDSLVVKIEQLAFSDSFSIYSGEYIPCKWSHDHHAEVTVQDLLIPLSIDGANSFSTHPQFTINKYDAKSVWLNIYIPPNTSGNHQFSVNITAFNRKKELGSYSLSGEAIVAKYNYPKEKKLKQIVSYCSHWTSWYYNQKDLQDSIVVNHLNLLNQFTIYPTHLFPLPFNEIPRVEKWKKWDTSNTEFFVLFGLSKDRISSVDSAFKSKMISYLKEKEIEIKKHNLIDKSIIFLYDEITSSNKYHLDKISKFIKSNGIESKMYSTCQFVPSDTLIDYWCPLIQDYDLNLEYFDTTSTASSHFPKWVYVCNTTPYKQYGNFFTDISPVYSRKVFWSLYERGIDYFQYYAVNRWDSNVGQDSLGNRTINSILLENGGTSWNSHTYKNHNGDGLFLYPADDQTAYPSVRLINYRDGVEDYELFVKKGVNINSLSDEEVLNLRNLLLIQN